MALLDGRCQTRSKPSDAPAAPVKQWHLKALMSESFLPFDRPWYLLLALFLPVLWIVSWRNLSGLGPVRRWFALGIRTIIFLLLIGALAEAYLPRTSDRLTVVYLLDQSESIPPLARKVMLDYCRTAVEKHQDRRAGDRVAVIVFGRHPAVEVAPTEGPLVLPERIETLIDAEFSDLEAAMNMAKALFPEDSAKRIVLVSDGSENLGDSRRAARGMAAAGIGIDVVAVPVVSRSDVSVDKISLPTDVRRGQPFEPRVVLTNNTKPRPGQSGEVTGTLRIVRRTAETEEVIKEKKITLPPGKTVESTDVPEKLNNPDFYNYEARFVSDDPTGDTIEKNNRATAYTQVQGQGKVLVIEDAQSKGQFDHLVDILRQENLVVTRQSTDQLFTSLAMLQPYDTVVLANVPRAGGGEEAAGVTSFSDEQISMLARNTQQLGAGLVMLGGPNSFGAGGWTNTEVEKALPVDMQIKNSKITPIGALVLVIDRSGSMCGEPLEICKQAAIASIKMLGPQDYVGVIVFDDQPQWVVKLGQNSNPADSIRRVAKVECGGGTDMLPAMREAYSKLQNIQTSVKHVIVLTDGNTPQGDHIEMARQARNAKPPNTVITTSSVAAGGAADRALLSSIAREGGGKFYAVSNLKTIPRIFMKEARRLATPLIYENQANPFAVRIDGSLHELTQGISPPPPITGFVQTTVKENPLVEVSMQSTKPADPKHRTILASWTYGLGRTVALTTDAGESDQRWAASWKQWPDYRKFFSRMIRWSMRPIDETGRFMFASDVEDGRIKVVVSAWDVEDRFLNDLPMSGTVVGPDLKERTMTFQQTAPGRYVGEIPALDSGDYMVSIHTGKGRTTLRTGVSVPYSAEFRDKETNFTLLGDLARFEAAGGGAGQLVDNLAVAAAAEVPQVNSFRHDLPKAKSAQQIWPLLAFLCGCLFLCDVGVRRVQISMAWMTPMLATVRDRVLRHKPVEQAVPTMARLQSLKAQVGETIERRRSATRFEPTPETTAADGPTADAMLAEQAVRIETAKPTTASDLLTPTAAPEDNSYTSRLLKAKKKVWEERQ